MDLGEYTKLALSATDQYLKYLKKDTDSKKGKSIIQVRKIQKIRGRKYKLFLSQRTSYIDAAELKICFQHETHTISSNDYKILSYNEEELYVIILANASLDATLCVAKASDITLESDLTFLVVALQKWYETHGSKIAYPPAPPKMDSTDIVYPVSASREQIASINSALEHPISYIWGAPGTGKTKLVLSGLLMQYIRANRRVLVMAPTNNALEQSLRGILEVLQGDGIPVEKVVRLGRPTSAFLKTYPTVCETGRLNDIAQYLTNEIDDLKNEKNRQTRYLDAVKAKQQFDEESPDYQNILARKQDAEQNLALAQAALEDATTAQARQRQASMSAKTDLEAHEKLLERQKHYTALSQSYRQYNSIVTPHKSAIQAALAELPLARENQEAVSKKIEETQNTLNTKEALRSELEIKLSTLWEKIACFFSRKEKERLDRELAELDSSVQHLRSTLHNERSYFCELNQQIFQLNEQVARETTLLQSSPESLALSRSVFNCSLSTDQLGKRFEAELNRFADFTYNDELEALVERKQSFCEEARNILIQAEAEVISRKGKCNAAASALQEQLHCEEVYNNRFRAIANQIFDEDLTYDGLSIAFQKFFDENADIVIDETLDQQISAKQQEHDSLMLNIKAIMANRCVIACTVDYATLHYDQFVGGIDGTAEHLFVDEAAYCSLIKAGIFFSFKIPVTLLGDHMQLPPVCVVDKKQMVQLPDLHNCFLWDMSAIYFPDLFINGFDINALYQHYLTEKSPPFSAVYVTFLHKTYRFSTPLASVLDQFIYHQGFYGAEHNQTTVTVIHAPKITPKQSTSVSIDEAYAIQKYLEENNLSNFAILTPYKKQLNLLNKILQLSGNQLMTIHASQGREWDTVIVSVTDSVNKFYMSSTKPNYPGLKLVNTAVSRAKRHLILVMDYAKWEGCTNELLTNIANTYTKIMEYRSK